LPCRVASQIRSSESREKKGRIKVGRGGTNTREQNMQEEKKEQFAALGHPRK